MKMYHFTIFVMAQQKICFSVFYATPCMFCVNNFTRQVKMRAQFLYAADGIAALVNLAAVYASNPCLSRFKALSVCPVEGALKPSSSVSRYKIDRGH